MSLLSVLSILQLTQQEQLDILCGLNAVLLEVLLYLLAPGAAGPLLGGHGAAHDDCLQGAGQVQPVTTPLHCPVQPCHSGEQYPCPATSLLRLRRTGCCSAEQPPDKMAACRSRRSAEQPEAARWSLLDTLYIGQWTVLDNGHFSLDVERLGVPAASAARTCTLYIQVLAVVRCGAVRCSAVQ